jgi:hypothetical protein
MNSGNRNRLKLLVLGSVLVVGTAVANQTDINCQCRDPHGIRVDLGTVECVNITGTKYLVRCEMSTNTPYWRRLNEQGGCPLA